MDQSPQGFASEDEEATYCLSLLRDGDRHQQIVRRREIVVHQRRLQTRFARHTSRGDRRIAFIQHQPFGGIENHDPSR